MAKVRLVHEMSGGRPDGQPWPPPGGELEVSAAEAAELTRADPHLSDPIAVLLSSDGEAEPPDGETESDGEEPAVTVKVTTPGAATADQAVTRLAEKSARTAPRARSGRPGATS